MNTYVVRAFSALLFISCFFMFSSCEGKHPPIGKPSNNTLVVCHEEYPLKSLAMEQDSDYYDFIIYSMTANEVTEAYATEDDYIFIDHPYIIISIKGKTLNDISGTYKFGEEMEMYLFPENILLGDLSIKQHSTEKYTFDFKGYTLYGMTSVSYNYTGTVTSDLVFLW